MNEQNQTTENINSPTSCPDLCTITTQEFLAWSLQWFQRVTDSENLLNSFQQDALHIPMPLPPPPLTLKQIYFTNETVQNLLSSVGIKNIHARFVIADNSSYPLIPPNAFTIVLYATDTEGRLCSAYHAGTPVFMPKGGSKLNLDDPHQICDKLAARWIDKWNDIIDGDKSEFKEQLFLTNYGFINGYNYVMSDFMYALYPPGANTMNYDVAIYLAAHEHIAHTSNEIISTFGLVLGGVQSAGQLGASDPVYYDLSLPSPPNH